MLRKLMKRFGGEKRETPTAEVVAREDHEGFELRAAPIREGNVWRVAGTVAKTEDGEERTYDFVRADTYPSQDDAAAVSLRKARQIVDEQGDTLWR